MPTVENESTKFNEVTTEYNEVSTENNKISTEYNGQKHHKTVAAFHM